MITSQQTDAMPPQIESLLLHWESAPWINCRDAILFSVDIDPRGMPRARTGQTATGKITHRTPQPAIRAKGAIARAAIAAGVKPIKGAADMLIVATIKPPEGIAELMRVSAIAGDDQVFRCMKKPDDDNIAKLVRDALTGIAYIDDKQLCGGGGVHKIYTLDTPKLIIAIAPLLDGR